MHKGIVTKPFNSEIDEAHSETDGKECIHMHLTQHGPDTSQPAHRRRVIVIQALAGAALVVALLAATAMGTAYAAGDPGVHHQAASTTKLSTTSVTCSGYGCDGQDPVATGCWNGAYVLGGDPSYTQVLWSPACSSNYAYLPAPSGYNQVYQVIFGRAAVGTTRNYCDTNYCPYTTVLYYCEQGQGCGPTAGCQWCSYFKAYIQPGWRTFQTDLLYAANQAVQVCVTYLSSSGGPPLNTCSSWH